MKKIIKSAMAVALLLLAVSCQEYDFGYNPDTPDRASTEYSRRFANRDDVNVNIVTQTPGAPYFVYFDNPYDADGNYNGSTAYLQGRTPLNTTLSVPRHVDSLYIISPMREMVVMPVGDVNINEPNLFEDPVVTRVNIDEPPYQVSPTATAAYWYDVEYTPTITGNAHVTNDVMNYVNSCFPSGTRNPAITSENLAKNTDLVLPEETSTNYVAVWITYLGKGAEDPNCNIWFYVYPKDTNPTSILLYGLGSDGKIASYDWKSGKPNLENPLFQTKKLSSTPATIFVGYVKAGYQIGLCYQETDQNGQAAKSRFTTPSLNNEAVGGGLLSGGLIINKELEVNGEMHEFNFIGMERQTPKTNGNNQANDNDFNDALLCIETNPVMKPKEDVPIDPIIEKVTEKGYYLFEDLYDKDHKGANDNDFNDVVVYYEKSTYNLGTEAAPVWKCDFSVDLLASACVNTNSIGVYHKRSNDYRCFSLLEGITGQYNMDDVPVFNGENSHQITFTLETTSDVVLPYLRTIKDGDQLVEIDPDVPQENADNNVYTTTYGTKNFPFVIEVPYQRNTLFQWSREGVIITDTYPNWNKTATWYTDTPTTGCYVPRTSGGSY